MLDTDDLYKYVGLTIIAFFVIFIVCRTLNFQADIIEGMTSSNDSSSSTTDKDKIADAINANTTNAEDTLLIDKYKKSYEDIIINLENNINFFMLGGIINNAQTISKNPLSPAAMQSINGLNSLKQFKDTLNDGMNFLDKTS
jgi:hypothetical protein